MITEAIRSKFDAIRTEMNEVVFERQTAIDNLLVALIAQQHYFMLGEPGTAKSMMADLAVTHITGARLFSETLAETTPPEIVVGGLNVPKLVELGVYETVTTGKLADCHIAFLDEFWNANTPLLHSIMKILNERTFEGARIPLRTALLASNKVIDNDADLTAVLDRIQIRDTVHHVRDRSHREEMARQFVKRQLSTFAPPMPTQLTLGELTQAHDEAMSLVDRIDQAFTDTLENIHGGLEDAGVRISSRRYSQGMVCALANAWVRGHDTPRPGDLDILQHMWFTQMGQVDQVRKVVLAETNPSEVEVLKLLDDLDALRTDLKGVSDPQLDTERRSSTILHVTQEATNLINEGRKIREKALVGGTSTTRVTELIDRAGNLLVEATVNGLSMTTEQAKAYVATLVGA